ncbi:MAG TPA: Tim44/TimA family putative adaptor protein [Aestuariivirgaceae bacterium]|nr:Tim44/TimA family putative adaptor protein [Aestuariivirgaceae bacterium]
MNQVFDPLNLLILAVAVVILLRLRSVLGTRTGHERRYDPYSATEASEKARRADGKVIPLPGNKPAEEIHAADSASEPVWQGVAEEGSALAKSLEKVAKADKSFDVHSFLEGAKMAYEMIVTAFAQGNRKALKPLLSKDVYEGFAEAIAEREKAGETVDTQIVGIDKAEIVAASLHSRRASITVKFQSQMISVKRDSDGAVIDGDERAIQNITDVWSFDRDVTARDPNWRLVATEET